MARIAFLAVWGGVALAALCGRADAQPRPSEAPAVSATVVAIDGNELVLDAGREQVTQGTVLTLYRTIEVEHPLTGKKLRDKFRSGQVRIEQPGTTLSIARVVGDATHPPAVGDVAEGEPPKPAAPEKAAPPAGEVSCAECKRVANAQRELLEVWYLSLGREPAERIKVMRDFLQAHPGHAYSSWFEQEIAFFQDNRYAAGSARIRLQRAQRVLEKHIYLERPSRARAGQPLEIAVYRNPEVRVRAVRLYVRQDLRNGTYQGLNLQFDERGHGRVKIPRELVRAPGFAYFLEVEMPDAGTLRVLGSDEQPIVCSVISTPEAPDTRDASRVRLSSEYVSFDGLSGRDYYYLFEGDYLVRLPYRGLESVRLGYGHYRGEGGSVDALDERGEEPRAAAFTYGYLEGAFAIQSWLALMPRIEVGLGRATRSAEAQFESEVRGGFQLRLRLGPERGTHLVLAGETVPEIGQRAFVGLRLGLLQDVPIGFEVHVTDQPVNTDELGVRAVLEVGYRVGDVVALAARASYQGRTIDHTGPGLGLAATFDW